MDIDTPSGEITRPRLWLVPHLGGILGRIPGIRGSLGVVALVVIPYHDYYYYYNYYY